MGGVMKTCVVKFIRKGDAGDPAVTYRIQLLSATAHVDTDKVMRGAITWNVIKEVSGVETYINSSTGTHQCKLSSASSWSTAGSSGNNFNDNGLINGVSFSTAGSPTHLLIRFVLGGNVKCTLAVGISVDGVKGEKGDTGDNIPTLYLKGTGNNHNADAYVEITKANGTKVTIKFADATSHYSEESANDRGLLLVTINRNTLAVVEKLTYDTYYPGSGYGNTTHRTSLANKLNGLSSNVFVCLVSRDAVGWNDALVNAIKACGGRNLDNTETGRFPFAFLGYKGLNEGYALQVQQGSGSTDAYAELSSQIINGVFNISKGEPGTPGGQGPRGYRGPALRGPQDWSQMDVGFQFYKGDADTQEPYEDFVVYNGTYYKCKKTHTKTSTNYPGSTYDNNNHLWQLSDKVAMVAANVLFAKHGYFGSAIISGDWLISTNGMIDNTFCENGATYQGIIAYSLFNENNPSGDDVLIYGSSTTQTKTASETTKTIATVSLEAGKLYYLKATGKAGSASGQYFIRIRNTSTGTTNTPVMINGTSNVTRSGYFSPGTTDSYYLEFYDTSGISAEVSAIELTRKDFAPTFALDLLTGTTYQHDGVFTGFIRKGKTKITTSNIDNYKRTDITTAPVLDFDKCGSFIELSTGTASYFSLPLLSSAIASRYTAAQKDRIRSFIGTKLLVYNYSGVNLSITWKWTASGGTYGYTLYNGNCVELECKMDKDDGDNGTEVIYWEINKTAAPV